MSILKNNAIYALLSVLLFSACSQTSVSPELERWRESGDYLQYQSRNIFYHDSGGTSSDVILMMHGFPTSSWDWRFLWQDLKQDHRLVALDMLGFGFSDKPKQHQYSINEVNVG